MSVIIKYNGVDPFKSVGMPTPFLSRSSQAIFNGSRKGTKETISLSGDIYNDNENCNDFEILNSRRDSIINSFKDDYKNLTVEESGSEILNKEFVRVVSISFDDSRYVGQVKYSIELECIEESFHNEFYGVVNPSSETSISKTEEDQFFITRVVSAEGFDLQDGNLSGNNISSKSSALQNAIEFVESRSGKENVMLPEGYSSIKIYLTERNESIDRLNSRYSVSESYIADKTQSSGDLGVLRYSLEIDKSFDDHLSVVVSGVIDFGIEEDFNKARNRYKNFDFLTEAENKSGSDLVNFPTSESVIEDPESGKISFNLSFDNDFSFNSCGVANKVDYSIENSADKFTVSVSGEVTSRGPVSKRFPLVESEFYNNIRPNVFSKAKTELEDYYGVQPVATPTPGGVCQERVPNNELKETPTSYSIIENRKAGKISYNYSFESSDKPDGFLNLDYSSSVSPPSPSYRLSHNAGGGMDKFIISRSGFRKGTISISCSGTHDNTINMSTAEQRMRIIINELIEELECSLMGVKKDNGLITDDSITKQEEQNMISINFEKQYFDEIV